MSEYEVHSWSELAAAFLAAAMPTYAEARANPFTVVFGTCKYTLKEGVTQRRAEDIAADIRKVIRGRR